VHPGAVAGQLLAIAIKNAKTLDNEEVTKAFSRLNEETFYGPMQFASDHAQLRFVPLLQFVPEPASWTQYAINRANFTNDIIVVGPSRVQVVRASSSAAAISSTEINRDISFLGRLCVSHPHVV
jgi:hypothetical protein